MAVKNKTTFTGASVTDFIHTFVEQEQKKKDSLRLMNLMSQWSGLEPKMWGPTIIGYGSYHYKYASGHEGDAPIIGFSPRKAALSLYVFSGREDHMYLLRDLGKYTMGKVCIYCKKLDDLNLDQLEILTKHSLKFMRENYVCSSE